jgi:AcrR family transcriptional regulator
VSPAERRAAGRPASISLTVVLDHALALADKGGLEACTMRALSDGLGVTPMALYRVVESKQDLLSRLPDAVLGPVAAGVVAHTSAGAALRFVADALGHILDEHPNVASLFLQPSAGPNMRAASAHCIALLVAEGCADDAAFDVLRAVVAQVVGESLTRHDARSTLGIELLLEGLTTLLPARSTDQPVCG